LSSSIEASSEMGGKMKYLQAKQRTLQKDYVIGREIDSRETLQLSLLLHDK